MDCYLQKHTFDYANGIISSLISVVVLCNDVHLNAHLWDGNVRLTPSLVNDYSAFAEAMRIEVLRRITGTNKETSHYTSDSYAEI